MAWTCQFVASMLYQASVAHNLPLTGLEMDESAIADQALKVLRAKLPPRWELETQASPDGTADAFIAFRNPSGSGNGAILEIRKSLSPRDALALLGDLGRRVRQRGGNLAIVVAAPYISPRTRELLAEQQIGYVDLTGNVRIALVYPGVLIETQGASRDPATRVRPNRGLAGAMVGKIVRVLVDTKPPYGVMDIARAAEVSAGYTSRVLDVLDLEALIERGKRGPIEEVRWPELIRRRAESVDLFQPPIHQFISPIGARRTLDKLGEMTVGDRWVVTGSFAAVRIVQIAAPALLVLYSMDPLALAEKLELRPAQQGADVTVVRPRNSGVFLGMVQGEEGINWVAASQMAIDCLSGTGRMPSEGEALIEWMANNESNWRADSIEDLNELWSSTRWG